MENKKINKNIKLLLISLTLIFVFFLNFKNIKCSQYGDFILDNILKTDNDYCLLDWRQDFGNIIKYGDLYYDFAKMYHALIISGEIIRNNQFEIKRKGENIIQTL